MSATQPHLFVELPDGWSRTNDIRQTTDGRSAGVAEPSVLELQRGGGARVTAGQPVRSRASVACRQRRRDSAGLVGLFTRA